MKKIIKVDGLDCANCAAKLEDAIKRLDGVNNASVSFMAQKIIVDISEEKSETIISDIKKLAKKNVPDVEILG